MSQEIKISIGIGLLTFLIIVGGSLLMGRQDVDVAGASTVDQKILLRNKNHTIASNKAKITLVEFADFQCPACAAYHPIVKDILEKYKGKITFIYRHFPLPQHNNARLAAKASEAASEQGKFWEMYDLLYEKQSEWSESNNTQSLFTDYARTLGLNKDTFNKALNTDKFDQTIQQDYSDGVKLGINSTPTFFLNGQKLQIRSFADLSNAIDEALRYE